MLSNLLIQVFWDMKTKDRTRNLDYHEDLALRKIATFQLEKQFIYMEYLKFILDLY